MGGSNLTHAHPKYLICICFIYKYSMRIFSFSSPSTTFNHPPTSYLCLSWLSQVKAWAFSTFCTIIFCTTSRAWTSMVQMVMIRWRLALVMSPSRRWISVFSWVTCKQTCRYKLFMPKINSEASERLSFLRMWPVCCCIGCPAINFFLWMRFLILYM